MRKSLKQGYIVLTILLTFLVAAPLSAQNSHPPAWVYNIKKINMRGFDATYQLQDWIVTGKRSSVGFLSDYNQDNETSAFVSIRIDQRGNSRGSAAPILTGIHNTRNGLDALWIESQGDSPSPGGESNYGLAFVAYTEDADGKNAVLAVAKFDADGQRITAFNTLKSVTAPAGDKIFYADCTATRREGTVGLTFSIVFHDGSKPSYYYFTSSQAWFAEVDLDGKPLASPTAGDAFKEILLPNGGRKQLSLSAAPAWNGSRWIIPFRITYFTDIQSGPNTYQNVLKEDVSMAIGRKGAKKIQTKRLFGHTNPDWVFSYRFFFLPRESIASRPTSKVGDDLDLFYQQGQDIPFNEIELDYCNYIYGIERVNGKGRRVGAEVIVEIPKWNHQLIYDPAFPLYNSNERVSSAIPDGEGEILIACTRSLERMTAPSTFEYEQELCLYNIDRTNGKVTLRAIGHPGINAFFSQNPRLDWLNGKLTVINGGMIRSSDSPLGGILYPFFTNF
jgi:hypothetical protein